jgi:hypothetical protein
MEGDFSDSLLPMSILYPENADAHSPSSHNPSSLPSSSPLEPNPSKSTGKPTIRVVSY